MVAKLGFLLCNAEQFFVFFTGKFREEFKSGNSRFL